MAIPLQPIQNSPAGDERSAITCLHCGQSQSVARKAMSVVCKFCHKSLRLEDLPIKDYQARRSVETCGVVTVEKKGQIVADRVLCGGMVIRGKVKATIHSAAHPCWPRRRNKGGCSGPIPGGRARGNPGRPIPNRLPVPEPAKSN